MLGDASWIPTVMKKASDLLLTPSPHPTAVPGRDKIPPTTSAIIPEIFPLIPAL